MNTTAQNIDTADTDKLEGRDLSDAIAAREAASIDVSIETAPIDVSIEIDENATIDEILENAAAMSDLMLADKADKDKLKESGASICDNILRDFQLLLSVHDIEPNDAWEMIAESAGVKYKKLNVERRVLENQKGIKNQTLTTMASRIKGFYVEKGAEHFLSLKSDKEFRDAMKPAKKTKAEQHAEKWDELTIDEQVAWFDTDAARTAYRVYDERRTMAAKTVVA